VTQARLTVLSGPTAVGKGTVVARLAAEHPEIFVSVSATTRPPRPGEVHGEHYLFVSAMEFDALIADGALLEWAVVHGVHRYGTPRAPVQAALAAGRPALLEIDLQGARQVKATCPEAMFVFLAPPSWEELVRGSSAGGPRRRSSGSGDWPRRAPSWPPAPSSTTSSSIAMSARRWRTW
jgi:guanylate kinase